MATILIVDDEAPIRALLRAMLEQVGYQVVQAPHGRAGLALYRDRPVDLVITDIHMPEMNGLDLMMELTRGFLNTKAIAISGEQRDRTVFNVAKLLGARHTLQKPFTMDALLRAVDYELAH